MATLLPALRQVSEDLVGLLGKAEVRRVCRELDHTWRERRLDPWTTRHTLILQVCNQNTAMTHLPHLLSERFKRPADTRAVCGVIVGFSDPSAIERWAKAKEDWLKELLALPKGIPARDFIRRVPSALQPEAFQTCFQSWMMSLVGKDEESRPTNAIDGKTMRRSYDGNRGRGPLHMVSRLTKESMMDL